MRAPSSALLPDRNTPAKAEGKGGVRQQQNEGRTRAERGQNEADPKDRLERRVVVDAGGGAGGAAGVVGVPTERVGVRAVAVRLVRRTAPGHAPPTTTVICCAPPLELVGVAIEKEGRDVCSAEWAGPATAADSAPALRCIGLAAVSVAVDPVSPGTQSQDTSSYKTTGPVS